LKPKLIILRFFSTNKLCKSPIYIYTYKTTQLNSFLTLLSKFIEQWIVDTVHFYDLQVRHAKFRKRKYYTHRHERIYVQEIIAISKSSNIPSTRTRCSAKKINLINLMDEKEEEKISRLTEHNVFTKFLAP